MSAQKPLAKPLIGLRFLVLRVLPAVCGGLLLAMVVVTVVDVVGRYLFNAPLPGAFELTQVLLADLVLAGLPITTLRGGHVEVDILASSWSERSARIFGAFGAGVSALVLFALGCTVAAHGYSLFEDGAVTNDLNFPVWPAAALGALTFVVSGLIVLLPHDLIGRTD
ncbi:TRAP transporter small permease [Martelella alba]|uniref:TRAP transporter small permease protein n=1 Tax=Martelella alba TaxID=2590451 RepID=A0A506UEA7_9HYPH|nr:TRAP transporter small permease [Martelella alba]TPW31049.1 TRAP transporter small permease [Martelella alba]